MYSLRSDSVAPSVIISCISKALTNKEESPAKRKLDSDQEANALSPKVVSSKARQIEGKKKEEGIRKPRRNNVKEKKTEQNAYTYI